MVARPAFSFLICPDGQLLRAHIESLLTSHAPGKGQWERHVYWGDEEPTPRFWEQLTLQGLFGTSRAVVVRQAQLWPANTWGKISKMLTHPAEQCWPLFCLEGAWDKGQPKIATYIAKLPCMSLADSRGWIWRQDGLNEYAVKKYVLQRAKTLHLSFMPDALEQFCATVPLDAQAIEGELNKLCLLVSAMRETGDGTDAGRVTYDMIGTADWSPECNNFACIRLMEAGNLVGVWKELARSDDKDRLCFTLLALLEREVRLLWQMQAGENVRMPPRDATFKRTVAGRLGAAGIAAAMSTLVDAELQVKSGRRSPEQCLEYVAAHMTTLFGTGARAK